VHTARLPARCARRRSHRPVARSMRPSTPAPRGCPLDASVKRSHRSVARSMRPSELSSFLLRTVARATRSSGALASARSPRLPEERARRESAMPSPHGCPHDELTSRRFRALVTQSTAPSPPHSHRPVTRATSPRRAPDFVLCSRLPGCSARRVLSPPLSLRLPFVTSTLRAPATYSPPGCPRDELVSRVERLR